MAFSKANPDYLEGKWKGTFGFMKPIYLTFSGNHITVFQDNPGPDIHREGSFYFDDKTILVFFDNEIKRQVWNYEMNNGSLNLLKGKLTSMGVGINTQYMLDY